jgi:eukaryotic-like serine/threonine-protein kinase
VTPAGSPDPERVRELFDLAADQAPERRETFVIDASGGDGELCREVLALLACMDAATLDGPALGPTAPPPLVRPSTVGRFTVLGKVGEGGMGVVFRGRDPTLDRDVALKLVNHSGGDDGQRRLLREAQAMARVAHPNVVPVYEVGVHRDQVFVAMELVRGTTMKDWLRAGPRTWRSVLQVIVDAGRGLAAAHRAGLLHRDVKPDNLLIGDDGRARIADFGLARAADVPAPASTTTPVDLGGTLTADGMVVGSPGFMSPEHFIGTVTPFADQWSLAATAYHGLFGTVPYVAASLGALREAVLSGQPPTPPRTDAPPAAVAAILRGLARHPADRFPSVEALVDALVAVLAVDPDHDANRFRRQRRGLAIAIAAGGVASFVFRSVVSGFRYDGGMVAHLAQAIIGLVIMVSITVGFRRALWGTTHDRRFMSLVLVTLAAITVHRAVALDADVVTVLRGDAVYTGGLLVLGAVTIERWLAVSAALMAAFLATSFLLPSIAAPAFGPVLASTLALGIWFWRVRDER